MLSFLFDANTRPERDDTKKLFARLQELEHDVELTETERDEDLADVLDALERQHDISPQSHFYAALTELLHALADESDLYTQLYTANDVFVDDVVLDVSHRARMARKISLYTHADAHRKAVKETLYHIANVLLGALPEGACEEATVGAQTFHVRLTELMTEPPQVTGALLQSLFTQTQNTALFHTLKETVQANTAYVHESIRKHAVPEDLARDHDAGQIIHLFLRGTCLESFFSLDLPFTIPQAVRFEHMHIVAGSGHGKTQTLQYLISRDLEQVQKGKLGFAVIDSQGDLIRKISQLEVIGQLQNRVIIVDPNDITYPPALNMFDMGLSHTQHADTVEREKIINGTVDLYAYIFSSLLGAELTQKQGVIFTYLARMMMVIPGANIRTLQALVEDGTQFKEHFHKLDPLTRHFFETQFFTTNFAGTRKQVLTRLWGVLSNNTFERMFSARENRVNLFEAMNEGKIVLINTAKDLLKTEGCSIFGRFFIALTAQAALSRSILPEHERTPFMVYIDEAHDYFDDRIEDIANQARKYNVGLSLSHQNLDQASAKLRASIISSTSIKIAGGVSAKDAQVLAQNMQTKPETILSAKKTKKDTQFACYVRNLTAQPLMISIPFGVLEGMKQMSASDQKKLRDANRKRVSVEDDDSQEIADLPLPAEDESDAGALDLDIKGNVSGDNASIQKGGSLPGRGGFEHKQIQHNIKLLGEDAGLKATIERRLDKGLGHIDVALEREGISIAVEISVTTDTAHELKNLDKCLKGGFDHVIAVCEDKSALSALQRGTTGFAEEEQQKLVFLTPDEVEPFLSQFQDHKKRMHGYSVEVEYANISAKKRDKIRGNIFRIINKTL